ncbi:AI-2E family transporter [Anaerocolumna sp.]|uniref:AI-2E family transporter n=1 Tax=Anaerocolumna sp. TaxID=2041569 RepID=UPI0028A6B93C|nr:AI-2E family transporter [Anaerocolumna sp.]
MKLNKKLNEKYTLISIYVIVTAMIIYSLSLVAKSAPAIFQFIMDKLSWLVRVARPIVLAFVFAYIFDPVIEFFEKNYRKIKIGRKGKERHLKSPRTLAVLTTIILIVFVLSGIISLLVFSVTDQIRFANFDDLIILAESYKKNINDFYSSVLVQLNKLDIQSEEVSDYVRLVSTKLLDGLKVMASSLVSSISNISSYLTTFIFSTIIGIYFMIDGAMIKKFVSKVGKALLGEKSNKRISRFIEDVDHVFSGYIRGQLTDAVVMMILISLTLSVVGVKFAFLIGIIAGIGNLVPYLGPFIAYGGSAIVCLINGQYRELLIAVIALFIVQTLDGNVIQPKLLSQSIEIHPVLVIISLIFGNAIGGLLGMLLAVPVGALIKVLFVRYIDYRLEKKNGEEGEEKGEKEKKVQLERVQERKKI